jgi:hypothetical protein
MKLAWRVLSGVAALSLLWYATLLIISPSAPDAAHGLVFEVPSRHAYFFVNRFNAAVLWVLGFVDVIYAVWAAINRWMAPQRKTGNGDTV